MASAPCKKVYTVTEPYLKHGCRLGESLHYDEDSNTLTFIDVPAREFHTINLSKGPSSHQWVRNPQRRGHNKVVPVAREPSVFLAGAEEGFAFLDKTTAYSVYVAKLYSDKDIANGKTKGFITNDGVVDSNGRFWLSKLGVPLGSDKALGVLFRLDADLSVHTLIPEVYITDSAVGIYAFEAASTTFTPMPDKVFFSLQAHGYKGGCDGCAMDTEGCLWSAIFNAGRVLRINPSGNVLAEIHLPAQCITDVCFVGEDLFITTAQGDPGAPRNTTKVSDGDPFRGCLFKVHVGVKGRKLHDFVCHESLLETKLEELRQSQHRPSL